MKSVNMASDAPGTLMTGTTTQILIDTVDLTQPRPDDSRKAVAARLKRLSVSLAAFAAGCGRLCGAGDGRIRFAAACRGSCLAGDSGAAPQKGGHGMTVSAAQDAPPSPMQTFEYAFRPRPPDLSPSSPFIKPA